MCTLKSTRSGMGFDELILKIGIEAMVAYPLCPQATHTNVGFEPQRKKQENKNSMKINTELPNSHRSRCPEIRLTEIPPLCGTRRPPRAPPVFSPHRPSCHSRSRPTPHPCSYCSCCPACVRCVLRCLDPLLPPCKTRLPYHHKGWHRNHRHRYRG